MQSLYGIYENGKITLQEKFRGKLPDSSNVLVTFVSEEDGIEDMQSETLEASGGEVGGGNNEEYYRSIREFERVEAEGKITVIDENEQITLPLNDYSQGGLSFISQKPFNVGHVISAGITDPGNTELVLMELKMEIRGVFKTDDEAYKIGCMFLDPVDEDLWHGLLQYLG
jgi:PilZ domain